MVAARDHCPIVTAITIINTGHSSHSSTDQCATPSDTGHRDIVANLNARDTAMGVTAMGHVLRTLPRYSHHRQQPHHRTDMVVLKAMPMVMHTIDRKVRTGTMGLDTGETMEHGIGHNDTMQPCLRDFVITASTVRHHHNHNHNHNNAIGDSERITGIHRTVITGIYTDTVTRGLLP